MSPAVFLGLAVSLMAFAVMWLRFVEQRRADLGREVFRLRFPRDTDAEAVIRFVAGLSGLRPAWYRRWLHVPTVILEVRATKGRIEHVLVMPRQSSGFVLSQLRAALPSVRLDGPVTDPLPAITRGALLEVTSTKRPLRTDHPAAM